MNVRRSALGAGLFVAAAAAVARLGPTVAEAPGAISTASPEAIARPFDAESAYNRLASRRAVRNSAAIIASIFARTSTLDRSSVIVNAGRPTDPHYALSGSGNAVYRASPSDPSYRIRCRDYGGCPPLDGRTIHVPAGVRPGGEGHIAIVDPAANLEVDLFDTSAPPPHESGSKTTTWEVGFGGWGPLTDGAGPTGFTRATGYGSRAYALQPYGATHSDTALTLGQISPSDLLAGTIPHALDLLVPCMDRVHERGVAPLDYVVADTVCDAGTDDPRYGMRIALDATPADLARLGLDAFQTALWTAMSRYGAIVADANCQDLAGKDARGHNVCRGKGYFEFSTLDPLTTTSQEGENLWDGVYARNRAAGEAAVYHGTNAAGDRYYFSLAPAGGPGATDAADWIRRRLYVAEPDADEPEISPPGRK